MRLKEEEIKEAEKQKLIKEREDRDRAEEARIELEKQKIIEEENQKALAEKIAEEKELRKKTEGSKNGKLNLMKNKRKKKKN